MSLSACSWVLLDTRRGVVLRPDPSGSLFDSKWWINPSGTGKDCMSQHSSGDDRLAHELGLALRDSVQRQRLADYFAILQEWSLERQAEEPISAQSPEESNVGSGETARVSHLDRPIGYLPHSIPSQRAENAPKIVSIVGGFTRFASSSVALPSG